MPCSNKAERLALSAAGAPKEPIAAPSSPKLKLIQGTEATCQWPQPKDGHLPVKMPKDEEKWPDGAVISEAENNVGLPLTKNHRGEDKWPEQDVVGKIDTSTCWCPPGSAAVFSLLMPVASPEFLIMLPIPLLTAPTWEEPTCIKDAELIWRARCKPPNMMDAFKQRNMNVANATQALSPKGQPTEGPVQSHHSCSFPSPQLAYHLPSPEPKTWLRWKPPDCGGGSQNHTSAVLISPMHGKAQPRAAVHTKPQRRQPEDGLIARVHSMPGQDAGHQPLIEAVNKVNENPSRSLVLWLVLACIACCHFHMFMSHCHSYMAILDN
jgi:hypothetical protein